MGFDPMTAMAVTGGASLLKGGIGAIAAGQGAAANAANQRVQAQIALNNAAIARQNAQWEGEMGEYKTAQTGLVGAAKVGSLIAAGGKSGIDVNSGSALKVRAAATQAGQQDTLVARSDMARKVYGYQVQANNFENQAAVDRVTADNAESAAPLSEFASLLGGAAEAAPAFGKFKFS